jgi:hypothetical protein
VATKRQRRRREKERRHEYEYVYVDEEGQEVEVDEPEPEPKPKPTKLAGQKPTPGAKNAKGTKTGARTQRVIEPPSWELTFRRAAIFVPLMILFLYFTRKGSSTAAVALQALFLGVVLILFMYGMDSLMYRAYQKRLEKRGGSPPKSK